MKGSFYPANKETLEEKLDEFFKKIKKEKDVLGGIVPHAGYEFSGKVAGEFYSRLEKKKCFILLGPNHSGFGPNISVYSGDLWETPLGEIKVNKEKTEALGEVFTLDEYAHFLEHSIEVQLPFIQRINPDATIVPICILNQSKELMRRLGEEIFRIADKDTVVIATSDFSHYVPQKVAEKNDSEVIEAILNLDVEKLFELAEHVSMCGPGPVGALMHYILKKSGKGKLLKYATSGDITGEESSVVGYAAIIFKGGKK